EGILAIVAHARRHFHETAEDRTRSGTRTAPRKYRKLARIEMQPELAISRDRQRRKARCRRSQSRAGREVIGGFDVRTRRDACTRTKQVEERADLPALRSVALVVQRD